MRKVAAVIVAAGLGKRMHLATPKPFIKIGGKPILFYSLDAFEKSKLIDGIIVVAAKPCLKKIKQLINRRYKKLSRIVPGGATRARSVYNGLCNIDMNCAIVLIHDVARPLITQELIKRCVSLAKKGSNCIAAVPAKSTIKKVNLKNKNIISTPKRKLLYEAQTPQVFDKTILLDAYKRLGKQAWQFKDDASLVEACGIKVKVVPGDYLNIKITTKEDLKIAEALLKR